MTKATNTPQPRLTGFFLTALALLSSAGALSTDMYLPTFPNIGSELSTSASLVQLTLTAFMVGMALGQLLSGSLSDGLGRKGLMVGSTIIFFASSVGCAIAPNIGVFVALRFLQGLAGGTGAVLARAVIPDVARGADAARAFSLLMAIQGFAPVLAPILGGVFSPLVGWRGIFWILAGFNVAMIIVSVFIVPESLPKDRRNANAIRSLFPAIWRCLRRREFFGYLLAFAAGFGVMFSYIAASPYVYQGQLGMSTRVYGFAFAANAIGITVMATVSAKLAGRADPRNLLIGGLVTIAAASVGLLFNGLFGPYLWATLPLLFIAVGSMGLILGNATALGTATVRDIGVGAGAGAMGFAQFLTAGIVAPLVGLGTNSALSMSIGMVTCATIALFGAIILTRTLR